MKTSFAKKLLKILNECSSIDEFKCCCASQGVNVPGSEYSFAKWFYDFAVSSVTSNNILPSIVKLSSNNTAISLEWRTKFKKYLDENIDDIISEKKFKDLLSSYIFMLIADDDKYTKSFKRHEAGFGEMAFNNEDFQYQFMSSKDRLKMIWKIKNALKVNDFGKLLIMSYFKKHRIS